MFIEVDRLNDGLCLVNVNNIDYITNAYEYNCPTLGKRNTSFIHLTTNVIQVFGTPRQLLSLTPIKLKE